MDVPGDTPTPPAITLLPVLVTAEPAKIPKLAAVFKGTADWANAHIADKRNTLNVFKSPPFTYIPDAIWNTSSD
jgi:hypothetical protein